MKQQLFFYAILWHPNEKQLKDGQESKIVKEPATMLAGNSKEVESKAIRLIPKEYEKEIGKQIEIIVRPF